MQAFYSKCSINLDFLKSQAGITQAGKSFQVISIAQPQPQLSWCHTSSQWCLLWLLWHWVLEVIHIPYDSTVLNIHWKDWCWTWSSNIWVPDMKSQFIGKESDAWKDWRQKKGAAEDEMVREHQWLNGHELEQTPGDGERQGGLACHSPWGGKESNTTWWLNNNNGSTEVL